jgi:hypothetical protein
MGITVRAIHPSAGENPLIGHEFVFAVAQAHENRGFASYLPQQHQSGGIARPGRALVCLWPGGAFVYLRPCGALGSFRIFGHHTQEAGLRWRQIRTLAAPLSSPLLKAA